MQVRLDKIGFSELQSQAIVQAGQTMLNISFDFIKIFLFSIGMGRRKSVSQPAERSVPWRYLF
jgi:hypothetical protein